MNSKAKDIYSKIASANYGVAKWVQEMALYVLRSEDPTIRQINMQKLRARLSWSVKRKHITMKEAKEYYKDVTGVRWYKKNISTNRNCYKKEHIVKEHQPNHDREHSCACKDDDERGVVE